MQPTANNDRSFLNTFKREGDAPLSTFPSEKLGVSKAWNLPPNFDEHDIKHLLLERGEDSAIVGRLFKIISDLNPELRSIDLSTEENKAKYHILFGVASRFNLSDIKFFVEDGARYDLKNFEHFIVLRDGFDKEVEFRPSPATLQVLLSSIPESSYTLERVQRIRDAFQSYREILIEFRDAILAKSFFVGLWDSVPHHERLRNSINELRVGDVVRLGESISVVTEVDKGSVYLLGSNGIEKIRLMDLTDKANIDNVTVFPGSEGLAGFSSYSSYPTKLAPLHYIKEEEVNIFKNLRLLTSVDPVLCAKAVTGAASQFRKLLASIDPETGNPALSVPTVVSSDFEGGRILVSFRPKNHEQYNGPSSIVCLPLLFRDHPNQSLERSIVAERLIEVAILAPPEDDLELASLISQARDCDIRPELEPLIQALREHENVIPHRMHEGEERSDTALIEVYKVINEIERLEVKDQREIQNLAEKLPSFFDLFNGEIITRTREWGIECGRKEYSAACKEDFDITCEITIAEALRAARTLYTSESLQTTDLHPVDRELFWRVAKEPLFCRCEYAQTYAVLARLNERGQQNLKILLDSGYIILHENTLDQPQLDRAIEILNKEEESSRLKNFIASIITDPVNERRSDCASIRLGFLKDGRNKEGIYFVFGGSGWNDYPKQIK